MTIPYSVTLAGFLGAAAFSVWLLLMLLKLGSLARGKAAHPTNEVLEQALKAVEVRMLKLESEHAMIRADLRADTARIITTGDERASKLHDRIDPLIENTAFIKGQLEAFTESFRGFTALRVGDKS